jgi:trehalose-6-phosphatase
MQNISEANGRVPVAEAPLGPLRIEPLPSESRFYANYGWCLVARPRVADVIEHLHGELRRVDQEGEGWQRAEIRTNIFLLSCAVTDTIDDYVLGTQYDFSQVTALVPLLGWVVRAAERVGAVGRAVRRARLERVDQWRDRWRLAVTAYLRDFEATARLAGAHGGGAGALVAMIGVRLPESLGERRVRIPAAFRTQDLTHGDVFQLARVLAEAYPDRNRPVMIVGPRTAGSYFAPLIHAWLANAGYQHADWMTIRPTRAMGPRERAALSQMANRHALAVVVDEAPNTGGTLAKAVALVRSTGFAQEDVTLLVPIHATHRDWASDPEVVALGGVRTLTLAPAEWRKHQWLHGETARTRVEEYFLARGYSSARVASTAALQAIDQNLRNTSDEKFHTRLKRVFEVRLRDRTGAVETRFVMAKSVGWGWLGYHAFVCGARLAECVPPILGVRDGILYTEWLSSNRSVVDGDRERLIGRLASYTAARVKRLSIGSQSSDQAADGDQHNGFTLLAAALSKACGCKPAAVLQRARVRHELSRMCCPFPTLIDARMRPHEWVASGGEFYKTDFEHHGLGKTELNVVDPAYDVAEAILHFRLSPSEEGRLVREYAEASGDKHVDARLFIYKLLAGTCARATAVDNLSDPRLAHRHQECHEQYLNAGNFLTSHTTRYCASLSHRPAIRRWASPLVVLDIDGVLDKQIFGFPSTTAAGIQAVSLLHAHGIAVAVNTARSMAQVQEYCDAYGFVGGAAEYGGAVWDAVARRGRRLMGSEALQQLGRVSAALSELPGVFLDHAYHCGLRAYTFERGVTVPVPTLMIRNLLERLNADRLMFHQTFVDTTILPREIDKGRGLLALLELAGQQDAYTIAVGDSEADLPMFRVAREAFAPSHISCRSTARLLGCRIMDRPFQPGLLRAVRRIVHPRDQVCSDCDTVDPSRLTDRTFFGDLLATADQPQWRLLLKAALDPLSLRTFAKH